MNYFTQLDNIITESLKITSATYKKFNLDNVTTKHDNKRWPYRFLLIGTSGSGKTNVLLNLIQQDSNIIGKTSLYAKDLQEPKYQFLIKKREQAGIKNLKDPIGIVWMISTVILMIIIQKEREKF